MTSSWEGREEPDLIRPRGRVWLRVARRALPVILLLCVGVVLMAILRLIERPIYGVRRPLTPYITTVVCRLTLALLGIRYSTEGTVMTQAGAVVANHGSWLDIFVLNARKRVYFVSKAEVAGWPGIGLLAKITGTVFIRRDRSEAKAQQELFESRLAAGHRLLFFPEGTSTDGLRVLPFKSTLFAAFFADNLRQIMHVQPVSVIYSAPDGAVPWFYGWWGETDFADHLLHVLASADQGRVHVVYHPPVSVAECSDRKVLAKRLEDQVRAGMPAERQIS